MGAQKGCEARAAMSSRIQSQKLVPSLIFFLAGSYSIAQAGLEPMTLLRAGNTEVQWLRYHFCITQLAKSAIPCGGLSFHKG